MSVILGVSGDVSVVTLVDFCLRFVSFRSLFFFFFGIPCSLVLSVHFVFTFLPGWSLLPIGYFSGFSSFFVLCFSFLVRKKKKKRLAPVTARHRLTVIFEKTGKERKNIRNTNSSDSGDVQKRKGRSGGEGRQEGTKMDKKQMVRVASENRRRGTGCRHERTRREKVGWLEMGILGNVKRRDETRG